MELFTKSTYQERRQRLTELVGGGLILLQGNDVASINYKGNHYPFRQDSSFLYFNGIAKSGLVSLLDADSGKVLLFGEDELPEETIWSGNSVPLQDLAALVGIDEVLRREHLKECVTTAIKLNRPFYFLPPYRPEHEALLMDLKRVAGCNNRWKPSSLLIRSIVTLREVKDEQEIQEIESAVSAASSMFSTAQQSAVIGTVSEFELAARMAAAAAAAGCRTSFPIIATTRGQVLHCEPRPRLIKNGELLVVDAGAETAKGYASDITRTFPVGQNPNGAQKEIYQLVLDANKIAIEQIRPGVLFREIHKVAARVIAEGLCSIGLMKGDPKEIVELGAHALFFPHGLGHLVGLDVHDMEALGEDYVGYERECTRSDQFGLCYLRFARKLRPGHVITVEPGCYFIPELISAWQEEGRFSDFINYEKIPHYRDVRGIRVEDDVLVIAFGNRCLTSNIPKEPEELGYAVQ